MFLEDFLIHLPWLALVAIVLAAISLWLFRRSRLDTRGRSEAERALAESEARFRALFELNRLPIVLTDAATHRIVVANAAAAAFYQLAPEELIGRSMDRFHVLPPEEIAAERRRVLSGEKSHLLLRHRLDSGEIRDVEVHATPLRDRGRTLLFGIIHDVTARVRAEAALTAARKFFENTSEGVIVADADRRILDVNSAYTAITGFSREEVLGRDPGERRAGLNGPGFEASIMEAVSRTGRWSGELRARRRNGEVYWERLAASAETDAEGRIVSYVSTFFDISEQKRAADQLRLAATVFALSREAIVVGDAEGMILDANQAFSAITGYGREEAIGRHIGFLHEDPAGATLDDEVAGTLSERGFWSGETRYRRRDGAVVPVLVTISVERDEDGRVVHHVGQFSDISHLEEQKLRLERLAHHDALTGLPNRVLLSQRLAADMARADRRGDTLAVAYIDLDGFKAVNDKHGHEVGDHLLIAVSQRMQHVLRRGDTLARLGGDEFVAVLNNLADADSAQPILDRLLEGAAEPVSLGGLTLQVTASIGIAHHTLGGALDPDQLVRQADHAMYRAKEAGRNCLHVFESGA